MQVTEVSDDGVATEAAGSNEDEEEQPDDNGEEAEEDSEAELGMNPYDSSSLV